MELILVCTGVGVLCLVLGALVGHAYASTNLTTLFAQAKTGLSADEQKLLDLFRKGKASSAPAGGTAAPATATVTIAAGTTTAPPTSPS